MKKLLATLLFLGLTIFANATDIKMMIDNYPPYNMEVEGELQGLSIDVLDATLKQIGSKQTKFDVELLSWSKAYETAQRTKNSMVFSTTRTKSREKLFKWVGPIVKTSIGLIALKEKKIVINSIKDLNKYRIGATVKDIGETLLLENKVPKSNIYSIDGINSIATNFYKLERDKLDMYAIETKVAKYTADLNGFDSDDYEVVFILEKNELYFAFNRLTPDKTIQKWQKALDTIKANGIYNKIIKKY